MPLNSALKYVQRVYTEFMVRIYDNPPKIFGFLGFIILSTLPFTMGTSVLGIFTVANILAIYALSWDLLVGRTGQISLGHALFYGAGAYGSALLYKYLQWPAWLTVPISIILCAMIAIAIGIPALRVKGPYLALLTFSFPLAFEGFLHYYSDIFGSDTGIRPLPKIYSGLGYSQVPIVNYYFKDRHNLHIHIRRRTSIESMRDKCNKIQTHGLHAKRNVWWSSGRCIRPFDRW
jgi:hypothetical protein